MIHQLQWIVWAFLRWPGSTTGEIYTQLEKSGHRVRNITGRMSDARVRGVVFSERKDGKLHRFTVEYCPEKLLLPGNYTWESGITPSVDCKGNHLKTPTPGFPRFTMD
jgi:hypothetical protein